MPIINLRVKNYRSLVDVSVSCTPLTVFVGCNDEGKSNLLRALDLFFNQPRGGYQFDWLRDFSAFAKVPKNKAPQVEVSLTFDLPPTFSISEPVIWSRAWRRQGLLENESMRLLSGNELPAKSKAASYLRSIRYEYVPAIKSEDYFAKLLAAVHDMLDATVQQDIRSATQTFTKEIRKHTSGILKDLEDQLNLKSDLELPTDLRKLFADLEFKSTVGGGRVALAQRGDGVKVRHIPIILRWLAEQANHLSAPGKPRTATIWGYEEPENNLEIRRCFDLASFFLDNSAKTQTFLTTHSPVFYSQFHDQPQKDVSLHEVRLSDATGTKVFQRDHAKAGEVDSVHSSMGFLDLLEPHVKEWKQRVDELDKRIRDGLNTKVPTVFVEGPSDKSILEACIKRFLAEDEPISVLCSSNHGGGHGWVKDSLIAWHHLRAECLAVGVFDKDEGAKKSANEFHEWLGPKAGSSAARRHVVRAAGPALEVVKAGLGNLPVAVEELCPVECWTHAKEKSWLEDRPLLPQLYGFAETNVTFDTWLESKIADESLRLVARCRVKDDFKKEFSKHVSRLLLDPECSFDFSGLESLIRDVSSKLDR